MAEQLSINTLIADLKNEGNQMFGKRLSGIDCKPNSPEAFALWERFKPEVYGLGALLTDPIIKSAYEFRDNEHIIDQVAYSGSLSKTHGEMGKVLTEQIYPHVDAQMLQMLVNDCDPKTREYYLRLNYLILELGMALPSRRILADVETFIKGGINTGCDVMSNTNGVIGALLDSSGQLEHVPQIVENSYYFPSSLSVDHGEVMDAKLRALRMHSVRAYDPLDPLTFIPFNPDYFFIKGDLKEGYLDLNEKGKQRMEDAKVVHREKYEIFGDIFGPKIGCLARGQVDGISSFRQMFLWNHELTVELCKKYIA